MKRHPSCDKNFDGKKIIFKAFSMQNFYFLDTKIIQKIGLQNKTTHKILLHVSIQPMLKSAGVSQSSNSTIAFV